MIEAMVALAITAVSASVLLLAVEATIRTSDDAVESTIAAGMADQLVDEIMSKRYVGVESTVENWPFGPTATEAAGAGRRLYDDTDDYAGWSAAPPKGVYGESLGTGNDEGGLRPADFRIPTAMFKKWRQKVDVYYVQASNLQTRLSSGQTSRFRAVEVKIDRQDADGTWKTLAARRRVYAYFPPGN